LPTPVKRHPAAFRREAHQERWPRLARACLPHISDAGDLAGTSGDQAGRERFQGDQALDVAAFEYRLIGGRRTEDELHVW
jgi:hypothetical protein